MKKRAFALILAVVLLAQVMMAAPSDDIYFTAVNDSVLTLTDETMPFKLGGVMYVPYTVFNNSELDVYYSKKEYSLSLFNANTLLTFDLGLNISYDRHSQYEQRAYERNGTVYLPISFVCGFLGLRYSYVSNQYGPIVRICSDKAVLSDQLFSSGAIYTLIDRLTQYNIASVATPAPDLPWVSGQPSPLVTPTPEPVRKSAYITFDGAGGGSTREILDILKDRGVKATFFLTDISENGDMVRRIICEGHSIGINPASGTEEFAADPLLAFNRANEALKKETMQKTRILRAPSEMGKLSENVRDALCGAGYRIWDFNVDAGDDRSAVTGRSVSNGLIRLLERRETTAVILMHTGPAAESALPELLDYLMKNDYTLRLIRDTEAPVNAYGDVR